MIAPIIDIDGVEEVYLFGSRAYRTGSLRSDIDILVYVPNGIRHDNVMPIMEAENALDIFETTHKTMARIFANDSCLRRDNLIDTLDAKLLWSKATGYDEKTISYYSEIKLLRDHNFQMSVMPTYSKEQERFYNDHGHNSAFVIMPFRDELNDVYEEICDTFAKHNITAIKATEREYANDLFTNMKVYLACCDIAVAVFDKNAQDTYNPNVALEVGYMMAKEAKICLLKDKRLEKLPTDLISKLYKEYDPDTPESITAVLDAWIADNIL